MVVEHFLLNLGTNYEASVIRYSQRAFDREDAEGLDAGGWPEAGERDGG